MDSLGALVGMALRYQRAAAHPGAPRAAARARRDGAGRARRARRGHAAGRVTVVSCQSPEQVAAVFAAAVNAGDVAAALALWDEDAAILAPDGRMTRGRDAIEEALSTLVGNRATVEIEVSRLHAAADVAIATGRLRVRVPGRRDAQESASVVVYSRAGDGSWRIAIDAPWGLPA